MRKEDMNVYLAGGMLNRGEVMLREYEAQLLREEGLADNLYNPIENKEINDKQNAIQEGLAERIFRHDTNAIMGCNVFVAEAMEKNLGTCMEIAQVYTMNYFNDLIREIIEDEYISADSRIEQLRNVIDNEIPYKHIYTHYNDIRLNGIPETDFRRSVGFHQYLLGCILKATNEYPVATMEEVIDKIKQELINE